MRRPLSTNPSNLSAPFYKTQLCMNFGKGRCRFGEACRFAHRISDLKHHSNSDFQRNPNFQTRPCYFSFNGVPCPHTNCLFLHKSDQSRHSDYKTRLCFQWMGFGRCPYGFKCTYAHGEHELRGFARERAVFRDGGGGGSSSRRKVDVGGGKGRCLREWNVEKIGRIYGDWLGSSAGDVEEDCEIGM